jgi:hypothetical protein
MRWLAGLKDYSKWLTSAGRITATACLLMENSSSRQAGMRDSTLPMK